MKRKLQFFYVFYESDNNLKLFFLPFSLQTPEDCSSNNDCLPMIISWEGSVDIQSGDVLIVEIDNKLLISTEKRNKTNEEM